MSAPRLEVITAEQVTAALTMNAAKDALETALRGGLDPDAGAARNTVPTSAGHFLLMPWEFDKYCGIKVATVAPDNPKDGLPRINGSYLLFDAHTLIPVAMIDGVALTSLRTPALSAVAVDRLADGDAHSLLIFGTGPQAWNHLDAVTSVRTVDVIVVVAHSQTSARDFVNRYVATRGAATIRIGSAREVGAADIVVCCTSSATPLFDGELLRDNATVVAVGSHEPDRRELDDATMSRSTVVVESRSAAANEAGDIVMAKKAGALDMTEVLTLAEVIIAGSGVRRDGPRVFKSVGMSWEDLVIASAVFERVRGS
ncbi:MAG: ornithine cyclodeaminase family protein [Pseudonocardiaceae bacterium]